MSKRISTVSFSSLLASLLSAYFIPAAHSQEVPSVQPLFVKNPTLDFHFPNHGLFHFPSHILFRKRILEFLLFCKILQPYCTAPLPLLVF
nr:MAG TPA: hypothetical protein [Caudoviricetes sp.]